MDAKLVAWEYVPPGFELVIANKEICPESPGGIWNLWWNVKLTDDPEAWDSEIRLINKMQGKLGGLSLDHRLMRAQMAEFCRMHPPFPRSIDILCEEIGTGRFSIPVKMGCEGRRLLDSLGYHDDQSLREQRREVVREYVRSLERWLAQGRPESPTEYKVFGFVRQPTDGKRSFVEKLLRVLSSEDPSISPLKSLSESQFRETLSQREITGSRPFRCFSCEGSRSNNLCCFFMVLDAGLLSAGTPDEERPVFDKFRRFIEENILAYSLAINSWLQSAPPRAVTSLLPTHYIANGYASELARRVHSSLGKMDRTKEWLAACLLKTIKDNQRWHKRSELIDDFPDATSWFGE